MSLKSRRAENYWEPIYTEEELPIFKDFDVNDTKHNTGSKHQTCDVELLVEKLKVLKKHDFTECDFHGVIRSEKFTFSECKFIKSDLGRTTWKNVKFSNCQFLDSTLTQATFENCQFIKCTWKAIGVSGNETIFNNCQFDNPDEFINSAYTNLDPKLDSKFQGTQSVSYRFMRLEQTKLKVARSVLKNIENAGDDESYYKALKTYLNQSISYREAKIKNSLNKEGRGFGAFINRGQLLLLQMERVILNVSGYINNWGESLIKPALLGLIIVFIFSLLYWAVGSSDTFVDGLIAGFDVTTLVGYTKHSQIGSKNDYLYLINVFLGLWWYAIFIPTVINRISKVRL